MPKKAATKRAPAPKKAAAKKKKKPSAPLVPLTGKQKSHLRSLAHPLKPVVQVGHQGLTDGVVAALDIALERHELIKLKVASEAELDASELAKDVEKATRGQVAQIIGRTLVVYRRRDDSPKIKLPRPKAKGVRPAPAVALEPELEGEDYLGGAGDEDDEDDEDDLE